MTVFCSYEKVIVSMSEIIDITNTFNEVIGSCDREKAHKEGLWHRTVNFLLIDSETKKIIFQNKKNTPINENFFVQINSAHLQTGESVEDGFRELEEETGIPVDKFKFTFAGIVPTAVDFTDDFKLREFMYYYVADVSNLKELLSENMNSYESKAFIGVNYLETYDMIVTKISKSVSSFSITKNSILSNQDLQNIHFKNFTDDNLYPRIFSFLKRFDNGELNMPL